MRNGLRVNQGFGPRGPYKRKTRNDLTPYPEDGQYRSLMDAGWRPALKEEVVLKCLMCGRVGDGSKCTFCGGYVGHPS